MRVLLLVWGLYREKKPQADVVQKAGGWAGAAALGLQLGSEHLSCGEGGPRRAWDTCPHAGAAATSASGPSVLKGCRHYRDRKSVV